MRAPVRRHARADGGIAREARAVAGGNARVLRARVHDGQHPVRTVGRTRQWRDPRAHGGPRPSCEALIAEHGGRSVGFALYFTTFSTFLCKPGLYLEDLFVEPGHRGAGIGKALLRRLAAIAIERDCGRFEWRVLDWNEPSIRFYESLGATLMPEWQLVRMAGPSIASLAKG